MEGSYPREIQFPQERAVRNIKVEQHHRLLGTSALVLDMFTREIIVPETEEVEAQRQEEYENPRHDELLRLEFEEDVRRLYHSGIDGVRMMLRDHGYTDIASIVNEEYVLLSQERVSEPDALEFIEATIRQVSEPIADRVSAVIDALRQRKSLPRLY